VSAAILAITIGGFVTTADGCQAPLRSFKKLWPEIERLTKQ
jgi:hypothetical protein